MQDLLLTIARADLMGAVAQVMPAVGDGKTLPILNHLLLEADAHTITLTGYDLKRQIISSAEAAIDPGSALDACAIPAKKLFDFVKALPENARVALTAKEGRLTIKAGSARATTSFLPAEDFPALERDTPHWSAHVARSALLAAIEATRYAMAENDARVYFNGALLDINEQRLRMVATDGHRLALCDVLGTYPGQTTALIPRQSVDALAKLLDKTQAESVVVSTSPTQIAVEIDGIQFSSQFLEGRYPDYDRVIPKNLPHRITFHAEMMRQAIARIATFADDKLTGARLTFEAGAIKIESANKHGDNSCDEVPCDYQGEAIGIGFNINYLRESLADIPQQAEIHLSDAMGSAIIRDPEQPGILHVLMPMRL